MHKNPDDEWLTKLLRESRTIAVVGLSPKPHRDSFKVASYLKAQGYRVIPVHPRAQEVLDERAYRTLAEIPEPVDIVNVFRRSEETPAVVEDAVPLRPRAVWLQLGIASTEAAGRAAAAGLPIVMDRCLMVEHRRLLHPRNPR
ncbi:MAG: CoA-binding protein [Thermoanaerobacterales bacterium]|nr:CoA-binding protein [Bacillota bacterium]MDI6907651.1 CoA-binding protein [Thermoanaerobacterales bacterium]